MIEFKRNIQSLQARLHHGSVTVSGCTLWSVPYLAISCHFFPLTLVSCSHQSISSQVTSFTCSPPVKSRSASLIPLPDCLRTWPQLSDFPVFHSDLCTDHLLDLTLISASDICTVSYLISWYTQDLQDLGFGFCNLFVGLQICFCVICSPDLRTWLWLHPSDLPLPHLYRELYLFWFPDYWIGLWILDSFIGLDY